MGINELALNAAASTLAQGLGQQNALRTKKELQDQVLEAQRRNLLEKEAEARWQLAMQLQTQRQLEKQRENAALKRVQTEHKYRMNEDIAKYKRHGKQEELLKYLNYKRQAALGMLKRGIGDLYTNPDPKLYLEGMKALREADAIERNYMKNRLRKNVYKKIYEDQSNPNPTLDKNGNIGNDPFSEFGGSTWNY